MAQQVIIYPAQSPATGLVVIVPAPGVSIAEASAAVPQSVAWREVSDSELPAGGRSDTWIDNGTTVTIDSGLLAANDAALVSARRAAAVVLAAAPQAITQLIRAELLLMMDELNLLRSWITSFKAAVAGAATLAALKTAVAALPDVPQRTAGQIKPALVNRIGTPDAD